MLSILNRATPAQCADMLARINRGETLSNADFAHLGYSFERFLQYAQFGPKQLAAFNAIVVPSLEAKARKNK